jgi:hypothetical protein
MPSFTLRTSWKKPATLRILKALRVWIVRLAGIVRVVRAAVRDVGMAVDVGGAMGVIVDRVRRCRLFAMRRVRWRSIAVLRR